MMTRRLLYRRQVYAFLETKVFSIRCVEFLSFSIFIISY